MGTETTSAAAAAETKAAPGEFSSEFMAGVFKRKGGKMPTVPESKTQEQLKAEETAKAEAEAKKANEGKTPEEIEAEETAKAEAKAAKENEGKTPEEIKAAADAKAEAYAQAEEEAKAAGGDEGKATAELVKSKLKDLPEATREVVQSLINERIGKVVFKTKAETARLENRVVELTAELETTRSKSPAQVVVSGVHPLMLVQTPAEIDAYADRLDAQEDMLEPLKDSGIEGDETKGEAPYSAEQVRARLRAISKERERILPQARELLTKRAATAATLKTSFPDLYNPTTEDYRMADALRKQLPELRRLPDADLFVAKFVLGARALADKTKSPTTRKPATDAPAGKTTTTTTTRKAPRAPGDGSSAFGSVLDDPSRQQPDSSGAVKTFTNSRSRTDLRKAVSALVFR